MNKSSSFDIEPPTDKPYKKLTSDPQQDPADDVGWFSSKNKKILIQVVIALIVLIIIFFTFVRSGLLKRIILSIYRKLSLLYHRHEIIFFVVYFSIIFAMIVFLIPLKSLTCMVGILIIKNPPISFALLHWTFMCASAFIYFISRMYLYNFIHSKVKDNDYFIVVKEESIKYPWRTCFIARLLYLPTGFKDYMLVMVDMPLKPYLVSAVVMHAKYVGELMAITYQFRSIQDMFSEEKSWRDKSRLEKFLFGLSITLFAIVIGVVAYMSYWATKQVERKRMEAAREDKEGERLDSA